MRTLSKPWLALSIPAHHISAFKSQMQRHSAIRIHPRSEKPVARMGNSLGGKKAAKIMKIDGETFKLSTPARVADVLKDHPGHVLMESESVCHLGVRARPLDSEHVIKPKRLYFLVQLPTVTDSKFMRKVRSDITQTSAKDRLERLMLSRRSASDLSNVKSVVATAVHEPVEGGPGTAVRVKMRLPKAQVAKLVEESKDAAEAAEKIVELYASRNSESSNAVVMQQRPWKPTLGSIVESLTAKEKIGVRFQPIQEVIQA